MTFAILARFWQPIAGFLAAMGVLLWGRAQKSKGASGREAKLRADANAQQMEAAENANRAAARVRDADPDERERLRDKWTRDD